MSLLARLIDNGIVSAQHILLTADQYEQAKREGIIDRWGPGDYSFEIVLGRIVCVQPTLGL